MRNIFRELFRPPEAKASRVAQLIRLKCQAARAGRRATMRRWRARAIVGNAIVHRCGAADRRERGVLPLLVYEGAREHDGHPLSRLLARPNPRQDGAAFLEARLRASAACRQRLCRGGDERRAAQVRELYALRPDRMQAWCPAPTAGRRPTTTPSAAAACGSSRRSAPLPPILHLTLFHPLDDHYGLSAAGGRGGRGRHPQRGGALEQGAARQRRAALRRAGLCRAGRRGAVRRAVRPAEARTGPTPIRARSMPGGRCCWKAGSTGRRCRCRPRTWISSRPSTPPRARSRSPSACRRCCSGFPATTPIANYQEANRDFWRQTVLPLASRVGRGAGALAGAAIRRRPAARDRHRPHRGTGDRPRRAMGARGGGAVPHRERKARGGRLRADRGRRPHRLARARCAQPARLGAGESMVETPSLE